MPKNIVLCSDGTGNSGNRGYNTNVWRLFTAINHQPRPDLEQVAFYDDGVGSEDFKILRAIGGAFGWGISLNLTQLYAFLMLHYKPGDRIYLFGFSRGAYTIRTLGNMIRYCGVADPDRLTASGIRARAAEALATYKRRSGLRTAGRDADGGAELAAFKEKYGLLNGEPTPSKHIPIEFIGVWDTVEALGLPIDELKHGLYTLFRIQFRAGENDLHPRIRHAYHALSIDDERLTFHPTLWDESFKSPEQTVEQVWFPGVHANVGGGYPKDQLSLVALNWIMKKAYDCGLEFHPSIWAEYQRDQDINGEMYDPRAGLGMYYRYAPRDVRRICVKYHAGTPKIFDGVFERIERGTDEYAPTGLPETYRVEPASPKLPESDAARAKRHRQLMSVRDIAWWRRVLYYLMLFCTIALVALAGVFNEPRETPDFATWGPYWRGLYESQRWLIDLIGMGVPSSAAPLLNALRHQPWLLPSFGIPFAIFFGFNWWLTIRARNLSVRAWQISLAPNPDALPPEPTKRSILLDLARWFRKFGGVVEGWGAFLTFIGPYVTWGTLGLGAFALVYCLAVTGTRWGSLMTNPVEEEKVILDKTRKEAKFVFDTRNSMQATPIYLERDTYYLITVKVTEEWRDNNIKAGPDGFTPDQDHRLLRFVKDWRIPGLAPRDPDEKWFTLMAQLGADGEAPFAIGKRNVIHAYQSGRLYLFVNDAFGFYRNNQGKAEVTVRFIKTEN